jgi:GxxExxY protein
MPHREFERRSFHADHADHAEDAEMVSGKLLHAEITDPIIGGYHAVYRVFGFGFLEGVYANALGVELGRRGLQVRREVPIEICYLGVSVGTYRVDLLVNGKIVVEVKAQSQLTLADERQLLNYLKATNLEVGLLFNFGPVPKFQRVVYSNDRK